ncbi:MAG: hypothetical protein JST86_11920 [Bacteroidetes bacterium]|nr:hypothetical protein [Bacteroidota bacterium]
MKSIGGVLLCCIFFIQAKAQTASDSTQFATVLQKGNAMAACILKKDYTSFVKYMYPPVIKMAGGSQKMASLVEQSFASIESEGVTVDSASIQSPASMVRTGTNWQCVVTQILIMTTPKGKILSKSALIAISPDAGKSWTFMDTHGAPLEKVRKSFPAISPKLNLPAKEDPVLVK